MYSGYNVDLDILQNTSLTGSKLDQNLNEYRNYLAHESKFSNISMLVQILENTSKANDEFSWLENLYKIDCNSKSPNDLEELNSNISEYLRHNRYSKCNEIFSRIDISLSPTIILIGLLRRTFIVRDKLGNWESTLSNVRIELKKRKLNDKQLLGGL